MANGGGTYESPREQSMAAYDKLPPAARKAIQDAVFDWATEPILFRFHQRQWGFLSGDQIAASIAQLDHALIRKKADSAWGADYAPMVLGVGNPVRRRRSA